MAEHSVYSSTFYYSTCITVPSDILYFENLQNFQKCIVFVVRNGLLRWQNIFYISPRFPIAPLIPLPAGIRYFNDLGPRCLYNHR